MSMTKDQIFLQIQKIVRLVLDDEDIEFTPETAVSQIPEWDSLNHMHIVTRLEKATGTDFQQSDFEGMVTVGDLVELVAARLP